jgi:uncharacterized protein
MNWSDIFSQAGDFLLACFSLSVLVGLIPAFLIAGGTNVFIPKSLVLKYLGADANKAISYTFATLAGVLISV